MQKDKRRTARVSEHIPVDVSVFDPANNDEQFKLFAVYTQDIGFNGLGLLTSASCMPGAKLKLRFQLPGRNEPIEATAVVKWSQVDSTASDYRCRVGIAFGSIKEEDHQAIMRYVGQAVKKGVGQA